MKKTVKFGGSSLADATQIKKCVDIIRQDPARMFVVPSAPGRRFKGDIKVTDMLIELYEVQKKDADLGREYFNKIADRYDEIIKELGIDFSLDEEYRQILRRMDEGTSKEYLVSRGEYLNGLILANVLGLPFLDAADYIYFDVNGAFDDRKSMNAFRVNAPETGFVMPGFYGAAVNGRIQTFSRGGSDITGSIVAKAMQVDVYENWTDVSGFLAADPGLVENPARISEICYSELRELSYMGAQVFHEEAIFPARSSGIPINIRNTNRPEDDGTWIVPDDAITDDHKFITGVAGKKGFVSLSFEKDIGSDKLAFGRKVLQVFEEAMVMVDHVPSSIGTMTVVVDSAEINGKEESILRRIRRELDPYSVQISHDLAMVAIVGVRMKGVVGITSRILGALAEEGISVRLVIQGIKEISLIIGIDSCDFEKTVRSLYKLSEACNNE